MKRKYKIVKKVNTELNHVINSIYQPAPSPDQADELLWIVDIYEMITKTIAIKSLHELKEALDSLGFISFEYKNKDYYSVKHRSS